jgi:hypothetical protein
VCPEILIQQLVKFPSAVTYKSLTIWSHFMDHRNAERVGYRNGIRSFRSYGQSEAQKLRSIFPLFCPEIEFSINVGRQNSVTSKPLSKRSRMSNG